MPGKKKWLAVMLTVSLLVGVIIPATSLLAEAGGSHSDPANLWAWGRNYRGSLGDGTTDDRNVPVLIKGDKDDWTTIAPGYSHTLALDADGYLWVWGSNMVGQLGDPDIIGDIYVPVRIKEDKNDWIAISAGYFHNIALDADGHLWAWGSNHSGQLGDGSNTSSRVPIMIEEDKNDWIAIDAGRYHTLALDNSGNLWTWGSNEYGQLGDGTTDNSNVPILIKEDKNDWIAISALRDHTMALDANGHIWAWGLNDRGQFGDGTTDNSNVPILIKEDKNDWIAISAGYWHTLALDADGHIWAWGSNAAGQFGDGTNEGSHEPVRIGNKNDWTEISAGGFFSVALDENSHIWAWGNNRIGQLGNRDYENKNKPVLVGVGADWITVEASQTFTVALAKPSAETVLNFTNSGTWEVPEGVTEVTVETWGGGGGTSAPGAAAGDRVRGGAGGGAYSSGTIEVIPGQSFDYVVGLGGSADGADGGDSYWIRQGEEIDKPPIRTVLAKGGSGSKSSSGAPGGDAAEGIGKDLYSGGDGADGSAKYGGGGGGAAGPEGDGGDAFERTGGTGSGDISGDGGAGSVLIGSGSDGCHYGGGAGGSLGAPASKPPGQSGAPGLIRITYVVEEVDDEIEVTVTVDPDQSKVYGDPDPTFTYTSSDPNATFTGELSRETGEDVGSYAIIQGTLAGTGDYVITEFVSADFVINQAEPTVIWPSGTMTYGETLADAVLTGGSASFDGENVAGKFSFDNLDYEPEAGDGQDFEAAFEPDSDNFSSVSGTITVDVDQKELTIDGYFTAEDKVYDGTTDATIDNDQLALIGVVGDDEVSLVDVKLEFADPNVGTHTVSITDADLAGNDAGNYTVSLEGAPTATADITAKELTITGAVAEDKVYDGTTDAIVDFSNAELDGVVYSEDVDFDASDYEAEFADPDVGEDKEVTVSGIVLTGNDKDNYTLTQPVLSAEITLRPITITAASAMKVYDGTELTDAGYELTAGSLAPDQTLDSVTVTGSQTVVGSSPNVPSDAVITDDDQVDVTENYDISYVNGTLTVLPQGALTTGNFNYFDMDEEDARQQFRLIFTPDYREAVDGSIYRLAASNPGQFRYNAFFDATGLEEITLTIPYPFVTQGAVPIHVYDAEEATYDFENGFGFTPGDAVESQDDQIALGDYDPEELGETVAITVDVEGIEGLSIVSIHLDYGPKRTTGWAQKQVMDEDKNPIAYEYCSETDGALEDGLELINNQDYDFSYESGAETYGEVDVFSLNEFKRNTGIGGLVVQGDDPVAGAKIEIYQLTATTGPPRDLGPEGELVATLFTDEDGWFLWAHQLRGRTTDFRVVLYINEEYKDEIPVVELNAMGYASADFYLED